MEEKKNIYLRAYLIYFGFVVIMLIVLQDRIHPVRGEKQCLFFFRGENADPNRKKDPAQR